MDEQESAQELELDRVRAVAERLDCFIEEDFQALAKATPRTVEAWRKRGMGPAYILLGNRYLYPRKALSSYLETLIRERNNSVASAAL